MARDNSACLHRLLSERQPKFLAALRAAERQLDLELSGENGGRSTAGTGGAVINAMTLYHPDGVACADLWSCARDDHTTVPPKCGAQGAHWPAACEFPAGHPGPHLPAA